MLSGEGNFLRPEAEASARVCACSVTGGELFEDIVAREYYSEADARYVSPVARDTETESTFYFENLCCSPRCCAGSQVSVSFSFSGLLNSVCE